MLSPLGIKRYALRFVYKPEWQLFPGGYRLRLLALRHRYSREGNTITRYLYVNEMMLIKSRMRRPRRRCGNHNNVLNSSREKRFSQQIIRRIHPRTPAEALSRVVDERKRELLALLGMVPDQKRLNKDAAFAKTVTRTFKGGNYTLGPNSNRYIFPIGTKYILLNPEIAQSPR